MTTENVGLIKWKEVGERELVIHSFIHIIYFIYIICFMYIWALYAHIHIGTLYTFIGLPLLMTLKSSYCITIVSQKKKKKQKNWYLRESKWLVQHQYRSEWTRIRTQAAWVLSLRDAPSSLCFPGQGYKAVQKALTPEKLFYPESKMKDLKDLAQLWP